MPVATKVKPATKPKPKPAPKPKAPQYWSVLWRAPGDVAWQVVQHYLGPFSDGVPRRFVSRAGSAGCVEDLIAAGLEAKAELIKTATP